MTISRPVYANREMVKRALDIRDTAQANEQVDRLLESSAESIDGELHRVFFPRLQTLSWDWPDSQSPLPWRLWLDDKEVISVSELASNGIAISSTDYILYPRDGPPFNRIELDLSRSSAFGGGSTHQGAISVAGLYGYTFNTTAIGPLVAGINSSVTALAVSNGVMVGVGDLLTIDSEYLLVTERGWADSTQALQTPLTESAANTTVSVTTGSAFSIGESILLDAEQMLIVSVAGNNLIVKRAIEGSVLASHTSSVVYVSRSMTVSRASVGSSASSHSTSAAIRRWVPPPLLTQLNVAETLAAIQQERSAYARVVGSAENAYEAKGIGLLDVRNRACTALGRKSRHRAV